MTIDDLIQAMKIDDHKKVSEIAKELLKTCESGGRSICSLSDWKKVLGYIEDTSWQLHRFEQEYCG